MPCKHCNDAAPSGFTTCGRSECQEADFWLSKYRAKRKSAKIGRRDLYKQYRLAIVKVEAATGRPANVVDAEVE